MSYDSTQVETSKKGNTGDSTTEFYHEEGADIDDSVLKKEGVWETRTANSRE